MTHHEFSAIDDEIGKKIKEKGFSVVMKKKEESSNKEK